MEHTLTEIASGDAVRATEAIMASALHSPEQQQVEACAVALTLSSDAVIRRAGVLAFGHLIRRFPSTPRQLVEIVLDRLNDDPDMYGAVSDLRDDLEVFRPRE
jgi:hypothetical protein